MLATTHSTRICGRVNTSHLDSRFWMMVMVWLLQKDKISPPCGNEHGLPARTAFNIAAPSADMVRDTTLHCRKPEARVSGAHAGPEQTRRREAGMDQAWKRERPVHTKSGSAPSDALIRGQIFPGVDRRLRMVKMRDGVGTPGTSTLALAFSRWETSPRHIDWH